MTRLVVCRGCCCGTRRRHPGVDHDGQLELLRRTRDPAGRAVPVRVADCLGPCAEGNIVVVHPSPAGRRRGARPVWLGFVNDDQAIELLREWISAGGPGAAPMPIALELHRIRPAGQRTSR